MIEIITSREIHVRLRRGEGTKDFIKRIGVSNEEELMEYIKKYHKHFFRDFKKLVKANDKLLAKG